MPARMIPPLLPPEIRADIVNNIGRVLEPGGVAIIGVRGGKGDVLKTAGRREVFDVEPGAIITSKGTYQKGFDGTELVDYLQAQLGDGFEVTRGPKIANNSAIVKKLR